MPLGKLARGRDRDHDPRPHVFAEAVLDLCAQQVRGAPGEVPQQLAAASEKRTQEARDRHHDMPVRNRLQHLLVEPLGP